MAFIRSRWVALLLVAAGLLGAAGLAASIAFYAVFVRDLPDLRSVDDYRPALASTVSDREGRPIGEYFEERRRLVAYDEIPKHVVDAFVAGEDSAFFEHAGIDYMSILRAAWVNLRAGGEIKQGGSTITQQMVKGLLLTPERKLKRKIKEMILARRIEQRFSKEDILYLYLNQIYFGHGAYGLGEAARSYFGKPVGELDVSEAAQLAGLPKAPSRYSPFANPEEAERRRQYVLERMLADGFIEAASYETAIATRPVFREPAELQDFAVASYFTEEVRRFLFEALDGERVLRGGLVVETTLDLDLQRAAVASIQKGLGEVDHRQGYRGPVRQVAVEDIEAELAKLAIENGIEDGAEGAEHAAAAGPALPDAKEAFLGVVTEVDTKAKRAEIAFGAGVVGRVELSDVKWARVPNTKRSPQPVRKIQTIFSVGDVARFERIEDDETANEAGSPRFGLFQEPVVEGALLSVEVPQGDVLAMVGGYDFARSQFNRATQAKRQPGSAFKPLIYGAAIAQQMTPASLVSDTAFVRTDDSLGYTWRPKNYGRSFYGEITLRTALARSVNNATLHLFDRVGVDDVMGYAKHLGIESPLNRDLSLALGSSDVTLYELVRAYATYPAHGRRVTPVYIRRVTDRDGNVLIENVELGADGKAFAVRPPDADAGSADAEEGLIAVAAAAELPDADGDPSADPDQLIPPEQAYLMADMLRAVVFDPRGTGKSMKELKRVVGGKTGTTNDQADAWFVGFSPGIATGVWVGMDEKAVLGYGETGARAAGPIWRSFMRVALSDRARRDFDEPEGIVTVRVDRKTGLLADAASKDTIFQPFAEGTEPTLTARTEKTTRQSRRQLMTEAF